MTTLGDSRPGPWPLLPPADEGFRELGHETQCSHLSEAFGVDVARVLPEGAVAAVLTGHLGLARVPSR